MTLKDLLKNYKKDPEYIFEGLVFDLSCELKELMKKKGITKKELARRMGVSPAYITKIFSGSNVSLKTVARVLAAMEVDVTLKLNPKESKEVREHVTPDHEDTPYHKLATHH